MPDCCRIDWALNCAGGAMGATGPMRIPARMCQFPPRLYQMRQVRGEMFAVILVRVGL